MVRPKKLRRIAREPLADYFKPRGVPLSRIEEVILSVDEFEAFKLSDLDGRNQTDAAEEMGIHQSTFHRSLVKARSKIADALVHGKAISITGGTYQLQKRFRGNKRRNQGGKK